MTRETIAIAIRSRREAPQVRFERSEVIGAGTIAIVVVDGMVIVRCASSAAVDALAFGGAAAPSALELRDGDIEVSVRAMDGLAGAVDASEPGGAEARTAEPSSPPAGLVVREAEWVPEGADTDFARFAHDDAGDSPTRMQLLSDVLPHRAPAAVSPPASPAPPPVDARRKLLRRVALVSMLVCAFSLAMRAARVRAARARALAHAAVVADAADAARASTAKESVGRAASSDPADAFPLRRGPGPAASPELAPATTVRRDASLTKPRRAADALANGAYADALVLYEELAAEHPENAAYDATARILRSRLDRPTVTSR
jgi:hypothetical protein